jgi:hypothetical protein
VLPRWRSTTPPAQSATDLAYLWRKQSHCDPRAHQHQPRRHSSISPTPEGSGSRGRLCTLEILEGALPTLAHCAIQHGVLVGRWSWHHAMMAYWYMMCHQDLVG